MYRWDNLTEFVARLGEERRQRKSQVPPGAEGMTMDRRTFIKASAAALCVAALPAPVLSAVPTDRERLNAMLRDFAVIQNEEFTFDDGQPIDLRPFHHVALMGCVFRWTSYTPAGIIALDTGQHVISHCIIETSSARAGAGIQIEHTDKRHKNLILRNY